MQPAEAFGGAERQGVLHIRRLKELGYPVVPLVGPGPIIGRALEQAGVHDYRFFSDLPREIDWPAGALERAWAYGQAAWTWGRLQERVLRLMRAEGIEVVFASRPTGWLAAGPAARVLRLPLLWRMGSRPRNRGEQIGLLALSQLLRPDLLLCNCEAVRGALQPWVHRPMALLRNGVDTERFHPRQRPLREELGIAPGVPLMGLAARPAPGKGLRFLAEVLQAARRRVPGLLLLIAGEFSWRGVYQEHFERLGLKDAVRFLGHRDDVERFYASCDVVVLSSRERSEEGSPNAVLEAMAVGRPIVATRVAGLEEILRDGQEGFLVPARDVEAFAGRLTELLLDEGLRARLGDQGRRAILAAHDDRRVAEQLGEILQRAARPRAARPRAEGA